MNPHDATEQAYRNGYEAGYKDGQASKVDIITCENCRYSKITGHRVFCTVFKFHPGWDKDGYCKAGKRREEDK